MPSEPSNWPAESSTGSHDVEYLDTLNGHKAADKNSTIEDRKNCGAPLRERY